MLLRLVTFHPSTAKTPKSRLWVSRNRLGDGSWGGDVQNAWLVVPTRWSGWWFQIFYFYPYLGKWSILTHIFQRGWFNHPPVILVFFYHGNKPISYEHPLKSSPIFSNEFFWATQIPFLVQKKTSPVLTPTSLTRFTWPQCEGEKLGWVFPNWGGGWGFADDENGPCRERIDILCWEKENPPLKCAFFWGGYVSFREGKMI